MIKNQTVNSDTHMFTLTKIANDHQSITVSVNFSANHYLTSTSYSNCYQFESILPRFNHDKLYFTPTFLLPCDQKFYLQNVTFEKLKFEERIQNAYEKHISQNYLQGTPPSTHCLICKNNFIDYYSHINSEQHTQLAAASPANQLIMEIVQKFQMKNPRGKKINKKRSKINHKNNGMKSSSSTSSRWTRSKKESTLSRTTSRTHSTSQIMTVPE